MPRKRISADMLPVLLATFVLDAIIDNPDRRLRNPNCLAAGGELRLIDHELAFPTGLVANAKPRWELGAMHWLKDGGVHLFYPELSSQLKNLSFDALRSNRRSLADCYLDACSAAMPPEWSNAQPTMDRALDRIRQARNNIDGIIIEVRRILQ